MIDKKNIFELKNVLLEIRNTKPKNLYNKVFCENPWFTKSNIDLAISNVLFWFEQEKAFETWFNKNKSHHAPKNIGIIMPGNIPLVGIHDLLSVLVANHIAHIKISHQDLVMTKYCLDKWIKRVPKLKHYIIISENLKNIDALIATGSDNSARYFNYYFDKIPRLIRKNRTSIAILDHTWTKKMYDLIALDILTYYGRGCRNVAKVFLTDEMQVLNLMLSLKQFGDLKNHKKYMNNYYYQKSLLQMEEIPHYDTGFLLLQKSNSNHSPLSVLYYDYYNELGEVICDINEKKNEIQCIVASDSIKNKWSKDIIPPGLTQKPNIYNYADNIDTSKFLNTL